MLMRSPRRHGAAPRGCNFPPPCRSHPGHTAGAARQQAGGGRIPAQAGRGGGGAERRSRGGQRPYGRSGWARGAPGRGGGPGGVARRDGYGAAAAPRSTSSTRPYAMRPGPAATRARGESFGEFFF